MRPDAVNLAFLDGLHADGRIMVHAELTGIVDATLESGCGQGHGDFKCFEELKTDALAVFVERLHERAEVGKVVLCWPFVGI